MVVVVVDDVVVVVVVLVVVAGGSVVVVDDVVVVVLVVVPGGSVVVVDDEVVVVETVVVAFESAVPTDSIAVASVGSTVVVVVVVHGDGNGVAVETSDDSGSGAANAAVWNVTPLAAGLPRGQIVIRSETVPNTDSPKCALTATEYSVPALQVPKESTVPVQLRVSGGRVPDPTSLVDVPDVWRVISAVKLSGC